MAESTAELEGYQLHMNILQFKNRFTLTVKNLFDAKVVSSLSPPVEVNFRLIMSTVICEPLTCRLCSCSPLSNAETTERWVPLGEEVTDCGGGGTISSLLTQLIPKEILFCHKDLDLPRVICHSCFTDLKRFAVFLEKVRDGQKKLQEKLNYVPKKRGRPKKASSQIQGQDSVITNPPQQLDSPADVRIKRTSRPPPRFELETGKKSGQIAVEQDLPTVNAEGTDSKPADNEEVEEAICDGEESSDQTYSKGKSTRRRRRKLGRPKGTSKSQTEKKCSTCSKSYSTNAALLYHKITAHQIRKDFQCNVCDQRFGHKAILANHMFTHSKEKLFKCEKCDESFQTRSRLITHVRNSHSDSPKPFICEACGRRFQSKSALSSHFQTHTGERPFKCEHCPKQFARKSNLAEHARIHSQEKPFACDHPGCSKRFTTSSQLRTHKFSHSELKRFCCEECGRTFNIQSNLKSHMKRHELTKQLMCSICLKVFADAYSLKKHCLIHSDSKPYKCDVCQKSFRDRSNMTKHWKLHGVDAPPKTASSASRVEKSVSTPEKQLEDEASNQPSNLQIEEGQILSPTETLLHIVNPNTLVELDPNAASVGVDDGIIYIYESQANVELVSVSADFQQQTDKDN